MSNIPVPMEGFGGGGGTSLNFKVVGNPQPANPKENTIWLNTDVKITGHHFRADQPDGMTEGEVWFYTGTNSLTNFNALKKGAIMVYPISAMQMVDGSLVNVTAEIYQNGEWGTLWDGTLYDKGNEYSEITGGWSYIATGQGTVVKNEETIEIDHWYDSTTVTYAENPVDLTRFNTLYVEVTEFWDNHGALSAHFVISPTKGEKMIIDYVAQIATRSLGSCTLDISGLSGEYYIGAGHGGTGGGYGMGFAFKTLRLKM